MKNTKLKAARAAVGLSQAELAQMIGVTRQTISMIESGGYNPTLMLCLSICHALDKTLDELSLLIGSVNVCTNFIQDCKCVCMRMSV